MYDKVIKVLLVEGDEDDYVITRGLLAQVGDVKFDLTWIASYQDALETMLRNEHDVCLLDYRLGEHDGVELLEATRLRGCKIPAILLTGVDDHQVDLKAMKSGASDYMIKDKLNAELLERSIRYAIERAATLEALRKSERMYRRIVETTGEGVWTLDADAKTNYVNRRMTEMLGYTADEMLGRPCFDFMNEDARSLAAAQLERRRQGMTDKYELQLRHRDGRTLWMSISGNPMFDGDDEYIGSLALLTDITGQALAENALRESNEKFNQLADNINDAFWMRSPDMQEVHYISPAFEEIWGRSAKSLYASPGQWVDFILPEDRERVQAVFATLMNAAPRISIEYRIVRPDGEVRWVHSRGFQVRNGAGELIRLTGIVTDITERKRAEDALRTSEERYRTLFETIDEGFCLIEVLFDESERPTDYRFLEVNPAFERQTGIENAAGRRMRQIAPWHEEFWFETYGHIALTGESVRFEHHAEQLQRFFEVSAFRVGAAGERKVAILFNDITERKLAEAERARLIEEIESERVRLLDIFTHAPAFIALVRGPEHVFELANQRYYDLIGGARDIIGMTVRDAIPEVKEQGFFELLDKVYASGVPFVGEEMPVWFKGVDGAASTLRYVNFVYQPLTDMDGKVSGIICHGVDVTEQVLSRVNLRESEDRYRDLIENSLDLICTHDLEGRILSVNRGAANLLGYEQEKLLRRNIRDILAPGFKHEFEKYTDLLVSTGVATGEMVVQTRAGELRVWEYRNSLRTEGVDVPVVRGIAHDVTERLKAERALKQSELTFRALFENTLDAVMFADDDGVYKDANPAACRLLGVSCDQLIGSSVGDFVEKGRAGETAKMWQAFLANGSMHGVTRLRQPDGGHVDVDFYAKANFIPGRHLSVLRDITERMRIEEALRGADRRAIREYAQLLDRIGALAQALGTARELPVIYRALQDFSMASVPCNGIFISLYDPKRNERRAVYAWSDGEEVDLSELLPMPMNQGPHSRAVATGQTIITDDFQAETLGMNVVNVGLDRDPRLPQSSLVVPMAIMGRIVGAIEVQNTELASYTEEHATALRMGANLAANAIENVQLIEREHWHEQELRQAQKMEAVGHLAGGVAHDFNNLLTAINGYSDLALRRADTDLLRQQLGEIKKAGERAAALTRQLLAFSRKQVLQPKVFNLNDVIASTIKMLHRLIGENIEITAALSADLGDVKADPGQIEQVLVNLVVNARDAMPDGGRIIIRTENVDISDETAKKYDGVSAGAHVRISVSDTGCGMDAETKIRIFEPFFTTKEVGKGTGLGLSTAYGIIKQSGGHISVYSEAGHGTTFRIYLQRISEAVEVTESDENELPCGDETVLLVEDDDLVRKIANIILEERGYTVLETSSGKEALKICREHAGVISLMLTDVVMPQMSGKELADQVAALRPGMRVLYMSGYTDDIIVHHGVLEEGASFLEKPFTPEALARKVREEIDAASGR